MKLKIFYTNRLNKKKTQYVNRGNTNSFNSDLKVAQNTIERGDTTYCSTSSQHHQLVLHNTIYENTDRAVRFRRQHKRTRTKLKSNETKKTTVFPVEAQIQNCFASLAILCVCAGDAAIFIPPPTNGPRRGSRMSRPQPINNDDAVALITR